MRSSLICPHPRVPSAFTAKLLASSASIMEKTRHCISIVLQAGTDFREQHNPRPKEKRTETRVLQTSQHLGRSDRLEILGPCESDVHDKAGNKARPDACTRETAG
jgi:hypothetical protein